MAEKEKKIMSIDDFTNSLESTHIKDIGTAFKEYDKYNHEDNQMHLMNNVIHPAMDNFYTAFKAELNKLSKNDDKYKVGNKHKELKKAAVAGLKKFFEKADPSVLKIEGLKDIKDDEKLYDVLVAQYDRIIGRNPGQQNGEGLVDIIEHLSKNKKATIGHVLQHMYDARDKHSKRALSLLNQQFENHVFSKYNNSPHKVGAYVRKEMKKYNWDVVDPLEFTKKNLDDYISIRQGVVKKRWEEGMDADAIQNKYGIKQQEAKPAPGSK